MRRHAIAVGFAVLAVSAARAAVPTEGSAHALALAAGYKAAFLCSGLFAAGETAETVAADDLSGIYPQYQKAVASLPATIDAPRHIVSVTFDQHLPPRVAAWRPVLGCAQLPIGADPSAVGLLPKLDGLAAPDDDALAWPQGEARLGDPHRVPRPTLDAVIARSFDHKTYGAGTETTAVVVADARQILAERYRPGWEADRPQRTWSVAKSLTASLIGRAVFLGLVSVDAPADIPEWRAPGDPRAAITLADLMHMASGLWTDGPGNRTDEVYLGGAAVNEAATAMPLEAAPGTRFRYANDDALLAARSLRASLGDGKPALAFPFTEFLWPLGMTRTTPETDWRGNFILSSQVWTTARDLTRLGLLYLADGVWNGKRGLPAGWAKFVSTPAPAQPEAAPGGGPGYGAFFWLYGPPQGLPAGTYAMEGNRGQYVFIVPAKGLVIVRRGFDSSAGGPQFDAARFVRDVLAAVK